jgi:hypothetical protein
MEGLGAGGLFLYTATVHLSFALFTIYRMTRRAAAPPETRAPYVVAGRPSRTTPAAIDLDPRAPDPADEAACSRETEAA